MIVLLRDDPMNVAGETGGSGIRMARPFSQGDLDSQTLIAKFKARAAFEFSGGSVSSKGWHVQWELVPPGQESEAP